MEYDLKLTNIEIKYIYDILTNTPLSYKDVAPLIKKIEKQLDIQNKEMDKRNDK